MALKLSSSFSEDFTLKTSFSMEQVNGIFTFETALLRSIGLSNGLAELAEAKYHLKKCLVAYEKKNIQVST